MIRNQVPQISRSGLVSLQALALLAIMVTLPDLAAHAANVSACTNVLFILDASSSINQPDLGGSFGNFKKIKDFVGVNAY